MNRTTPTYERCFLFLGQRRGGQHAIIYWVGWHWDKSLWHHHNGRIPGERFSGCDNRFAALVSFEDINFSSSEFDVHDAVSGLCCPAGVDRIVMIRDPFNLFASRLRMWKTLTKPSRNQAPTLPPPELWKVYAREFLQDTDYLSWAAKINYNRWFSSEGYRRSIEARLGLPECPNNDGLFKVPGQAGGSSFDRRQYNGQANKMKVMSRWLKYIDQDEYVCGFDDEILNLASRLFLDGESVRCPDTIESRRNMVVEMAYEVERRYSVGEREQCD